MECPASNSRWATIAPLIVAAIVADMTKDCCRYDKGSFHHVFTLSAIGLDRMYANMSTASAITEIVVTIFPIAIWSICDRQNPTSQAGIFDFVDI